MEDKLDEELQEEYEDMAVHTSHGAVLPPPPEIADRDFSDETLTRQLREALKVDQRLTQAHVNGDVWDSIAYLSGEASRPEEIAAAEEVARSIAGIHGVRIEIRIDPTLEAPDEPTEVM